MIAKNSKGQVIRIFTYSGQMRKHGSDRQVRHDALDALDTLAHARVTYSAPTVRRRRRA